MKLLNQLAEQLKYAEYDIDEKNKSVQAWFSFRERLYMGFASCHSADVEFFSERVGKHIALGKAYLDALNDLCEETRAEWLEKRRFYREVTAFGAKNPAEVDPTGAFKRNLDRAEYRYNAVKAKRNGVKTHLHNYLIGLATSHAVVKKFRERLAETN